MEPWLAPINGISLERYAELCAELGDVTDPEQQANIIARHGVHRVDWEAARQGWTTRMAAAALMGRVATAFMPLYRAALQRKSLGGPSASFDDFVALSGAAQAFGLRAMLAQYGLSMTDWTQIAGQWTAKLSEEPARYGNFGLLVEQEGARLRQGGAPKPVAIQRGAASAPDTAAPGLAARVGVGSQVLVLWNNGQRHPGVVTQAVKGQYLVTFTDGRQLWVPAQYVSAHESP